MANLLIILWFLVHYKDQSKDHSDWNKVLCFHPEMVN